MMSMNRFALPTLALFLIGGFSAAGTSAAPLSSPVFSGGQERGWDEPPREFNEIQRRGFRDGIEGARHDMDNHRNPDVDNRDEYRNANFPPEIREQYREAFRRGYMMAINRMNGGGPPPMAQPVQPPPPMLSFGWEGVPNRFSEIHRRGLQDGVEGARRDLENHRRPDPDNRDEYRNPNVPPEFREDYREGFRRGYEQTVSQLYGQPQGDRWDMEPGQFTEIQRRGFRDGVEGARKDADNHRRPDPDNREEYRSPNVPPQLRDEYREGFRWGYERAMAHLTGMQ
jgi:ribosome modulation factor